MAAANYRSLLPGGFFSNPQDRRWPVSLRFNNWGAINGATWQRTYPGYVGEIHTSNSTVGGKVYANKTTAVETPEQGVAMWWELMKRYRASGADTVREIIKKYGGGQNYSGYENFVCNRTGFKPDTVIDLSNDKQLLKFADAMFAYEAGVADWKSARAAGLRDEQILHGFKLGRNGGTPLPADVSVPSRSTLGFSPLGYGLAALRWLLDRIFKR